VARFFINPEQKNDNKVEIVGDDVKHITKVLRLKPGAEITVLDGTGQEFQVILEDCLKERVMGRVISQFEPKVEPKYQVTLIQGLPKGDKMDLIVQKCTELGIRNIIPVNTERSIVKIDAKRAEKKVKRWQKIAKEAAEQSKRSIIPTVSELKNLSNALENIKGKGLLLMPWEGEKSQGIKEVLKHEIKIETAGENLVKEIFLVIGPEGGFSEQEAEAAGALGAITISLGPRILRTETAGLAALTMVLYELGDLGGF